MENIEYMQEALDEARLAFNEDEIPVGAVIVQDGRIIGRGHNLTNTKRKVIAHAEIIALEQAYESVGLPRLDGAEMYVTLEPCLMCAYAIVLSKIKKVYIGTADPKTGACKSLYQILSDSRLNHQAEIEWGLLEKDCSEILKEFFRNKRRIQNESKQKISN